MGEGKLFSFISQHMSHYRMLSMYVIARRSRAQSRGPEKMNRVRPDSELI